MIIAPLTKNDATAALDLYAELTVGPKLFDQADFNKLLGHPGSFVFGAKGNGTLLGMVTLHILPNVTWGGRPYALIENVVTAKSQQGQGVGKAVMKAACDHAWQEGAFKIMLMTGKNRQATGFYEACGFSSGDKTAMIMRAPDA